MIRSSIIFRLLEEGDRHDELVEACSSVALGKHCPNSYSVWQEGFSDIPGSPFAYNATAALLNVFSRFHSLEGEGRTAKLGTGTLNDFRFLRLYWEVSPARILSGEKTDHVSDFRSRTALGKGWTPYAKGGPHSRYYHDVFLLVDWFHDGKAMKDWIPQVYGGGHWSRNIRNTEFYFRPGLTWSRRSQRGFSIRALPAGSIFADKGPCVFLDNNAETDLLDLLVSMNSETFRLLLSLQMAFGSFEVGVIQRTPMLPSDHTQSRKLAVLGLEAHDLERMRDLNDETTHVFKLPGLAATWSGSIATSMERIAHETAAGSERLTAIQGEIDVEVAAHYGLALADLSPIDQPDASDKDAGDNSETEDDSDEGAISDVAGHVEQLIQWMQGCVLGRWDLRMAHDPSLAPALQGPFDPLPVCSPGALVGPDGLPARPGSIASEEWLRARPSVIALPPEGSVAEPTISDAAYPLRIDWDGILVDDEAHPDDIVGRVREVLELLWGDRAEGIEQEAIEILSVPNLREYFRNPRRFWEFHVKRYSKSRRKAPIYWLLQSSKRSYGLWLYYHRMDADILYKALRTYVDPKIAREQHRLEELEAGRATAEAAGGRTRREHERSIDRQQALLTELEDFRKTLERVAHLDLTVDHDDGVLLSIAPLHELVPWKPAEQAWKELVAGKYEWSTMSQRMREKGLVRGRGRQ